MIVIWLLKLEFARTHLPVIFALQETTWDVPNLKLPGYVCCGSQVGLATSVVSDLFLRGEILDIRGEMYSCSLRISACNGRVSVRLSQRLGCARDSCQGRHQTLEGRTSRKIQDVLHRG